MQTLINCQGRRYRYQAERDCIEIKSPSGKSVTVYSMRIKNDKMSIYWNFSRIIENVDGLGQFTTDTRWHSIQLTKQQMDEFLKLSINQ